MLTTIIILIIVGIVALLFEMVLPGGILGVLGGCCLIAAVGMTFFQYGAGWGLACLGFVVVLGLAFTWIWMTQFHRLPFTRKLVHQAEVGVDQELEHKQELTGKTGTALTDIRPSGHAKIDGEKLDVISETGIIEKGAEIKVVETRGPSVIVKVAG
ncbi:MAG: NfeD family protein [Verrucomicrobiales bacterium]|nr:NfeD family protein [Verrucomicrobiales bacterium]